MTQPNGNPKGLLYGIIALVLIGLAATFVFVKKSSDIQPTSETAPAPTAESAPTDAPTEGTGTSDGTASQGAVDLEVDDKGLSKATVTLETTKGTIKYKFYSKDAPKTVARMVELIQSGFYNGLTFHRVEPGFVIQGGDPDGNGTGGSGQKLQAEFNSRKHIMGTVAMARAMDPNSADSQFYISLGTHPHLDNSYTVFGQVVEGIDVARKIEPDDKMTTVTVR